jgi:putative molybdopterin biosynthesis protein
VGSLGGLIALKRGHAHLAGAHLLDPESGEYNIPYIKKHLPGLPVRLITLVHRTQGLILKPGNPKDIGSLEDLARDDVSLINRQRGAGTRLLLDYHLQELGLTAEDIRGYDQEEFTHLTAAAAVLSGRADAALGIEPAARALEMDFIPLFEERYDLVIPRAYLEGPDLEPVLELLEDPDFRETVDDIAGYDAGSMGETAADLG